MPVATGVVLREQAMHFWRALVVLKGSIAIIAGVYLLWILSPQFKELFRVASENIPATERPFLLSRIVLPPLLFSMFVFWVVLDTGLRTDRSAAKRVPQYIVIASTLSVSIVWAHFYGLSSELPSGDLIWSSLSLYNLSDPAFRLSAKLVLFGVAIYLLWRLSPIGQRTGAGFYYDGKPRSFVWLSLRRIGHEVRQPDLISMSISVLCTFGIGMLVAKLDGLELPAIRRGINAIILILAFILSPYLCFVFYKSIKRVVQNALEARALPGHKHNINAVLYVVPAIFLILALPSIGSNTSVAIDLPGWADWWGIDAAVQANAQRGAGVLFITVAIGTWIWLLNRLSYFGLAGFEILLVIGLLNAFFDLSDNHAIRQLKSSPRSTLLLDEAFTNWLGQRPDIDRFKGKLYPVYIIAAEGGGLYAGAHAAMALGRLQGLEPRFAQHIFAGSGVSGGSLGLALFSALSRKAPQACRPDECTPKLGEAPLEVQARQLMAEDFLSPLILKTVTLDLLQRLIPYPIEHFDRTRALEFSLEAAWEKLVSTDNPFTQRFADHWHPSTMSPALLLNATSVESGARLVFSPFSLSSGGATDVPNLPKVFHEDVTNSDIRLSTAVILSARFPYVTPAGFYIDRHNVKRRVVDGGYYDNTGIETALDLIRALEANPNIANRARTLGLTGLKFILISVSSRGVENADNQQSYWFGELMSPFRAMIGSWRSRAEGTFGTADLLLNKTSPDAARFRRIVLASDGFELPLSWALSSQSLNWIQQNLPDSERCDHRTELSGVATWRQLSDCTFALVRRDLISGSGG